MRCTRACKPYILCIWYSIHLCLPATNWYIAGDKAKAASKVRENLIKAGTNRWKRIASHCFSQSVMQMHNYYVIVYLYFVYIVLYLTVTGSRQCQMSVNLSLGRARNKQKFATSLSGRREREREKETQGISIP